MVKNKEIPWSMEEIARLTNIFSDIRNAELAILFNRPIKSIMSKATTLKLRKSKQHKSNTIADRNKMVGRDLTKEALTEIALKYKTRGEFQFLDSSAYQSARRLNILDDICSHMISQSYSIPQLILRYILETIFKEKCIYNTRQIIKPCELDIYFPNLNLAFEYNGKGWHQDDKQDKKKLCIEKGINLITIVENNRKYEEDIKNQLVCDIAELRKYKNIVCSDILYLKIPNSIFEDLLDEQSIQDFCNTYKSYHLFITENRELYSKLVKLKSVDKFTKHMIKSHTSWTEDLIVKEVSKYEYLLDFINNSNNCYNHIMRNKFYDFLKPLKRKNRISNLYEAKK